MAEAVYSSVDHLVATLRPSFPVMCVRPRAIAEAVRRFRAGFGGRVLYAVKCNPHPIVLGALHQAGIEDFDTASLPEIALIREMFPAARCYFNHPVKSREAIAQAHELYGIVDFVADHHTEVEKIAAIVGPAATIAVRLATPGGYAAFDLSAKFGADADEAVRLLRQVVAHGCRAALVFHVGSQCRVPDAFTVALDIAARVIARAGVTLAYLDVGGGFPAAYGESDLPPLESFFAAIAEKAAALELAGALPLLCEPGRALVAEGAALLVQVHLRKDERLYINDGIFGSLSELHYGGVKPGARAIRRGGPLANELVPFRIYGPTCDSTDVLPEPMFLPRDIREGDWIEIGTMGAYSNALSTRFNGFGTDAFAVIDETARPAAPAAAIASVFGQPT